MSISPTPSPGVAPEPQPRLEFAPVQTVVYEAEQVTVAMNRYRLELLCDSLLRQPKRPTFDDALPWLAVFVALLVPLLSTADYKDFLGLEGDVWNAIVVIGTAVSGIGSLITVYRAVTHRSDEERNAKEIVEQLMAEMTKTPAVN